MDRDRDVSEHRFRSRGRNLNSIASIVWGERIADAPEGAFMLDMFELCIGDGRLRRGVPVDQPSAAVQESLAVELHEDLPRRRRETLIHRKMGALPIRSKTEAAELRLDLAAVDSGPLPGAFDKTLAAEILPSHTLARELFYQDRLRRDCGMVDAGKPVGIFAEHSMVAREDVHRRVR